MQKVKNKLKYVALALGVFAACVGFGQATVHADSITLSVERFTIGGGFLIEPTTVEIGENEKYSEVIPRAIEAAGDYKVESRVTGMGYYMEGIQGAMCDVDIPDCVQNILDATGLELGENKHTDVKGLYEFDYTKASGWMYTVNGAYMDVGMSGVTAEDGDVVRVMYTLSMGTDLFGKVAGTNGKVYYNVTDKTQLLRLMAEANAAPERWQEAGSKFTQAYQLAKAAMEAPDADETSVNAAVTAMQRVKDSLAVASVTGVTMQKELTCTEGDKKQLKYTFTPAYATAKSMAWSSSNPSVASVDENGTVSALKAGSSDITLTVDGTYKAVTTVTVEASQSSDVSGDINGDGKVNIADVKMLLNAITSENGNNISLAVGDINGDGKMNIADVKMLLNKITSAQ